MNLKITERIGIDLLMLESNIVTEINNKTKTYRKFPFRKTKEELEALNQWRQAIIESINIVRKHASESEQEFIKSIFLAGVEASKQENFEAETSFANFMDENFTHKKPKEQIEDNEGEQPSTNEHSNGEEI